MTRRGTLLFGAMCVIWGIPYLLIKVAVKDLSPATLVFCRTAIGAVLLVPIAAARGDLRPVVARWRPLTAFAAVEVAGPWLALSSAERKLSSSLSGLLVAAVPLVGLLLSRMFRDREPLDTRMVAGLCVGLIGVAALVGLDVRGANAGAICLVGVVMVGYAAGPVILARSLADLPGLGVTAAALALCAVVYAPLAAIQRPDALPPARVVLAVVVLGAVCTALAFVVFFHLIAEVGPLRALVITYVNPAVALALGIGFLGEAFTAGMAVGFPLVIAGSFLATRRPRPTIGGPLLVAQERAGYGR